MGILFTSLSILPPSNMPTIRPLSILKFLMHSQTISLGRSSRSQHLFWPNILWAGRYHKNYLRVFENKKSLTIFHRLIVILEKEKGTSSSETPAKVIDLWPRQLTQCNCWESHSCLPPSKDYYSTFSLFPHFFRLQGFRISDLEKRKKVPSKLVRCQTFCRKEGSLHTVSPKYTSSFFSL